MADETTLGPTVESHGVANQIITELKLKYIYFVIGSLGLTGNIFVIVVIFSYKGMRKSLTNTFIISQSFIDATVAFFLLLTTAVEDDGHVKSGTADQLFCRLWLTKMPLWGMLVTSTYNLVGLTFERFMAIVYPIWHKNNFSKVKAYMIIAFVWFFGPAYNTAYMVPTAGIQPDGSCTVYSIYPSSFAQSAVGVLTVFLQYLLPLSLLAFFYIQMWRVLRVKVKPGDGGGKENQPVAVTSSSGQPSGGGASVKKPDSMARARSNIIKTLLMVAFSFIFCWTWNQIFYLMFNLGYPSDFTSNFYHFTVVMVFCNCCINPFIYMAKYEQFQQGAKRLLCKRCAGKKQGTDSVRTATITDTNSS